MKNRNLLLLPVLAILTLFAITGCPGPTNTGREDTVTVTFKSYEGVTPLEFAIPVNETLGSTRYASVQALQTRDGYDFKGWALSGDTDPVKVDASSKWSVDTDYNGLWAPTVEAGENITITYNLNSFPGSQPADYTAISGDPITASALPDLSAQDYVWLGWSLTKDGSLVKNDAVFNSDTILYAIYISPGSTPVEPPEPVELDMPYGLHPLRTAVPADFIRGADISNCLEIETAAGVHGAYRNFDGQVEDIMKILTDNGINWVRVRLWVDPTKATDHYAGDGNNNMAVTKVIAARAKAAGMKFLLNIHYSDYWADPSHQQIPYIWKDITPRQSLLDAVYDYTVSAIQELTEAGAEPDMVALGNEIRSGLLSQHADGSAGGTGYALSGWGDYSMALSNASKAVRKAAPHAKIMIHFDMGGASSILGTYGNFTKRIDTGAPATNTEVDYDVVGLSWYTIWSSHSTIDNLYSNIQAFKSRYGKEVVVCETGYMWDIGNWDSMGNYAGPTEEQTAVAALTNSNGFVSDSDVQFAYRSDGTTKYVPSSPENQCRVTRATMDAIVAAGGAGIIWWGADWIALPSGSGLKSNSEMATIFASSGNWDTNGQVLPVIKVLGGIKGVDIEKPGLITGFTVTPDQSTVSLSWHTVNSAVASKYEVDRAAASTGPWTTVSDTLTTGTYTDTGLSGTYFYRIRGYNNNGWGAYSDSIQTKTLPFIPSDVSISTTINTVSLSWTALTGAVKYEISRAAAAAGPWTVLSDTVTAATYTDTGLAPETTYYYRLRAYNTSWGDYSDPAAATTLALPAVGNFRISGSDETSTSLAWNSVGSGVSGYEIYAAKSETEPADLAYALLASPAAADVSYVHSGLTAGDTWWYKIRAVFGSLGAGPWSDVKSYTAGSADWTAHIDMGTGSLDADFLDPMKASGSTDSRVSTDSAVTYTIPALYVANDNTNLYVAMDFQGRTPGGYQYDRFVVWVDNTSSSAGSAAITNQDAKLVQNATVNGSIEGLAYKRINAALGGNAGVALNATTWAGYDGGDWIGRPTVPENTTVLKFSIPLAGIGGAGKGTELKVLGSFAMGWSNGSDVELGGVVPAAAVTGSKATATITMDKALSYTVK